MKKQLWDNFLNIVKQQVVPALGCTEPISVALAAAIAAQNLSGKVEKIAVCVSPNLMKNAMGVAVPGTGMVGLPIAAAAGAIAGDPLAGLEVLKNITAEKLVEAKALIDLGAISVDIVTVSNVLYAKVTVSNAQQTITVAIADSHTKVLYIEENGITRYIAPPETTNGSLLSSHIFADDVVIEDLYDFALNSAFSDICFIEQAQQLNTILSELGLTGQYGLKIGRTFQRNVERGLLSSCLLTEVMMRTSAASDARMDGAKQPAMSNSGSGNQGITATMPVVAAARFLQADRESTVRALILSHLLAIYIKSKQHKLSALCAATTAAMGASAAITYLLGGSYQQMSYAISSMVGDISGIICDGAKASCAMKVSSSAGAAVKAALMALDNLYVTGNEGIVANDVNSSIGNLCALANGAMTQTDKQILEIMVNK